MLTVKVNMDSFYFMEETPFVQVFDKYGMNPYISYQSSRSKYFREVKDGEVTIMNSNGIKIDEIDLRKDSDGIPKETPAKDA